MEAFFILPDAEAGDARETLYLSVNGKVQTVTAGQVAELIATCTGLLECFDAGDKWTSVSRRFAAQHLRAALAPHTDEAK